jgi:NodT family efflux transporter outer membrane factor (OMF) lipoprotein
MNLRPSLWPVMFALAGCTTLGPDFTPPRTDWDESWTSPTLAKLAPPPGGADNTLWWRQFRDPALDALIAAAMASNRDLKVAGLRVLEARAQLGIANAGLKPQLIEGTASAGYGANAPDFAPIGKSDFAYATVGAAAAWELDFWGRFRRGVESADANYFANVANFDDFAVILRAEVARLYISYRTNEAQLKITRENAALQKRNVEISDVLFRNGAEGELDVVQARTQYLATIAAIPQLESTLQQTRNAIAELLGRPPGPLAELTLGPQKLPTTPAGVSMELPADLLRRRPDVRAAAFRAAAQSAQIGIAQSELYPSLTLAGTIGVTTTSLGGASNLVQLGVGPALRWNLFDFGRIRGNVRVQDARLEQALQAYQQQVVVAAREVDSAAIAFVKSHEQDVILDQSQQAAKRALDIAQTGYREGFTDFQRVLDAQAALFRQQESFVINRGQHASDLIAIYKAVGGGWILSAESDYADAATRARMQARSNWGHLLDAPAAPAPQDAAHR